MRAPLPAVAAAFAALAVALAVPAGAQTVTDANCAVNGTFDDGAPAPTEANGHVAWPADDPVWEFDFYRPANRTSLNGGGLEIRNVTFRGRRVLDRASVPVLNVEYDRGGCGCFRDWQTIETPIDLGPGATRVLPCLAQSAPGAVRTACEANADARNRAPGGDVGDFAGVAVEDYGDELVLTGHSGAGWYRYRMKWHFYADGRIWPEFSFAATAAVCTQTAHRHHAYWRFDFDLDGTPRDDVVREHAGGGPGRPFTAEASRVLGGPSDRTYWSVVDAATGLGYEVVPGEADRQLPADAFSKTDALVLRYRVDEIDDGLTVHSGCAFAFEPFVDGEALDGEDTVFWYRSGALHAKGSPFECDVVGPMLRPIGLGPDGRPDDGAAEIEPVRPNPSAGTARTRFRVPTSQAVSVELYDTAGRRVAVLFEGTARAGRWQPVRVDGRGLPVGTYVVRVRGETARATARVVLAR